MRNVIETVGGFGLSVFRKFDVIALIPVCMVPVTLCVLTEYFLPTNLHPWIAIPCLLFIFYMGIGYLYFQARNTNTAMRLAKSANAGDWSSEGLSVESEWGQQGIIPLLQNYLVKVQGLTKETTRTAEELLSSSKKASADTLRLSEGAEEIAAMLEETAAGLEEFTASIERSAQNCREVNDLAKAANEAAYQGVDQVSFINNLVDGTGRKSEKVLELIELIESFAIQTNMLALNASIEAARTGEHGPGFTQVADEVKDLAARSNDAAKLIRTRVLNANRQVAEGVKTAEQSSRTIEEVLTQVTEAQRLIEDVANAAIEQSSGVGQIKQAIEQIATLTMDSAASVDQAARIASTLEKEAVTLDENVKALKNRRRNEFEGG
jgi:methyl-accepting chemotaxis protein